MTEVKKSVGKDVLESSQTLGEVSSWENWAGFGSWLRSGGGGEKRLFQTVGFFILKNNRITHATNEEVKTRPGVCTADQTVWSWTLQYSQERRWFQCPTNTFHPYLLKLKWLDWLTVSPNFILNNKWISRKKKIWTKMCFIDYCYVNMSSAWALLRSSWRKHLPLTLHNVSCCELIFGSEQVKYIFRAVTVNQNKNWSWNCDTMKTYRLSSIILCRLNTKYFHVDILHIVIIKQSIIASNPRSKQPDLSLNNELNSDKNKNNPLLCLIFWPKHFKPSDFLSLVCTLCDLIPGMCNRH